VSVTLDGQAVPATMSYSRITIPVIPPHERGAVELAVNAGGDTTTYPLHYTTDDDFERVLIPIVTHRGVAGAYGALWFARSSAANGGDAPADLLLAQDAGTRPIAPLSVHLPPHSASYFDALNAPSGGGAIARIGRWVASDVTFTERVFDDARSPLPAGVSVPVVREEAFRPRLAIADVLAGAQERTQLRIYSMADHPVTVTIDVRPMPFTQANASQLTITVPAAQREVAGSASLDLSTSIDSSWRCELASDEPIWAMASVTNNDTNEVSIVWPQ
jgi:hypothetical protein